MVRLSVNVNKVATIRNSRTPQVGDRPQGSPSVVEAALACIAAGAPGITVHPRQNARHITFTDVRELAGQLSRFRDEVEFNIEGDARPELLDLVDEVRPHQFTLVPVVPGEVTSQAGWSRAEAAPLGAVIRRLQAASIRVSVFVDPDTDAIAWAAGVGADRVELFTEPFARAFAAGSGHAAFSKYVVAAETAHRHGLGINAGHDLDLENLQMFRTLPHLDEVSIGHALISRALFDGLQSVVERYLALLRSPIDGTALSNE